MRVVSFFLLLPYKAVPKGLLIMLLTSVAGPIHAQVEQFALFVDTAEINNDLKTARRYLISGRTDSAAFIYLHTLNQSKYFLYPYGIVKSMIGIGNTQVNAGNYGQAEKKYREALSACIAPETYHLLTTVYNNIGNIYTFRGDFEQSMRHYEQALVCAGRFNAELPLSTVYNNISIALNHLGQPEKALYYLNMAEARAKKNGAFYTLADVYNNKGFAYSSLGAPGKSAASFQAAIAIARKYGYINTCYSAYVNMGIIALNDNRFKEAIRAFKQADAITGDINPYYQNQRIFALGAAYLKLGSYALSETYLKKSVALCEKLHGTAELLKSHQLLAALYAETGKYQDAFHHRSIEKALSDSLNKKEMLDAVSRMDVKYRTALKDKEIANKQLTINRQLGDINTRNIWIVGVSLCLCILCGFVFMQWKNYRHRQKLKNEQLLSLERQQELHVIKAIMNGEEKERIRLAREIHDGIMVRFSVIKMNLSALIGNNQKHCEADRLKPLLGQLDEATDDLRRTAHNLMPDMLLEEGLPEAVYYFCNNLKKDVPFSIDFHPLGVIPRFDVQFELSVYRIVQELLQNIIKHAEATEVIVQLSFENSLLSLTVEDNGKGIPGDDQQEHMGLGVKSIYARAMSLNGRVQIESRRHIGTSVHLEFDLAAG